MTTIAVKEVKNPKPQRRRPKPSRLRFTPYTWAKLLFLRDLGRTEVGGFGPILAVNGGLLLVALAARAMRG